MSFRTLESIATGIIRARDFQTPLFAMDSACEDAAAAAGFAWFNCDNIMWFLRPAEEIPALEERKRQILAQRNEKSRSQTDPLLSEK
jgi:hypothetical protein